MVEDFLRPRRETSLAVMLTRPPFLLCSSWEYWQSREAVAARQHSWVIGFGRWIINFPISTFCLTAATLPQRRRRRAGWAACAAQAPGVPLGWVVGLGLGCPWVHEPGAVPWFARVCNLLRLVGKSAKCERMRQPRKLPQGGLQLQRAMSRSEDRAGLGSSFACAGERGRAVLFFPFFHPEKWLTAARGRKAVLCLCPPCRGVCRKNRS